MLVWYDVVCLCVCVWPQVTLLVDRVGSGLRNQEPGLVRAVVPVLQEHYPEMLSVAHVAPVNWFLYLIWVVFRFVLDPNTAKRVSSEGSGRELNHTTDGEPRRTASSPRRHSASLLDGWLV